MANLVGRYKIDKTNLIREGIHLVIGSRKAVTPQKPKYYLLLRFSNGSHKYVSSLFEAQEWSNTDSQAYFLDFLDINYILVFNRQKGEAYIFNLTGMPVKGVAVAKF